MDDMDDSQLSPAQAALLAVRGTAMILVGMQALVPSMLGVLRQVETLLSRGPAPGPRQATGDRAPAEHPLPERKT